MINITLKPEEFQAFQWIKNNTSQDSRFAILTNGGPVYDSIAEWFPALTKRTSVDTVFGTEWLRNESFRKNSMRYGDLQACLSRDESCIEAWAHQYNLSFSFILILKQDIVYPLITNLETSPNYKQVYDSKTIIVFERKP